MTNHDFDFLQGQWRSRQRRLEKVLAGCTDWYDFDATLSCQLALDGNGVFDVLRSPERNLEGITLRLYSPDEHAWRIWWASTTSGGRLDEPVVGRFDAGVGRFFCDDVYQGAAVRVRYEWSGTGDGETPHWEQAFSTDAGETWEVNWTADFHRP